MKIAFHSTNSPNGGFGILGKGILQALHHSNNFNVVYAQGDYLSEEIPDVILLYGMPDLFKDVGLELRKHYKKKIPIAHYFVWESSELPKDFVKVYKRCNLLLTATHYTKRQAEKQGLKPLVWHHGIDSRFEYSKRKQDGVFTFLHHNAYEFRKGWELVLQAFTEEFKSDEPVQLILKARERKQSVWLLPKEKRLTADLAHWRRTHRKEYLDTLTIDIPNVKEVIGHISDEEMVEINNQADCFVFPAKGEGWALPPFEAMAQGIVPIIPDKGCFTEWFDKENMIEVKSNGYILTSPRYPGYMFNISLRDLKKKMRWAYEHQNQLKQMGIRGSRKVRKDYNWCKVIRELYLLLKKYETN